MKDKCTRQISLRIDRALVAELGFIENSLNVNLSDAVKDAIHWRYNYLKNKKRVNPKEVLEKSGFIGSISRSKNSSTAYKQEILARVKEKHG